MARKNHTTNLTELLLQCMTQPDPRLSFLSGRAVAGACAATAPAA